MPIKMKTAAGIVLLSIYIIGFHPNSLFSQTLDERVDRLEKENKELKQKISDIEKNNSPGSSLNPSDKESLDWLKEIHKRVQPFGDLSFRYHGFFYLENVQNRGVNFSHVDTLFSRPETRIRVGLKGEVVDGLFYQVRLGTGPNNFPSGAWPPLDGFFEKQNFALDRYFLDWMPTFYKPLRVLGGKFQNPVSGTELIWDSDVGISGGFVEFDISRARSHEVIKKLSLAGLFYYLEEYTSDAQEDVFIAGASFQSKFSLNELFDLVFNLTYYDYHNADGVANAVGLGNLITPLGSSFVTPFLTSNLTPIGPVQIGGATPATLTNLGYSSDFNLINPYFEVVTQMGTVPVKVYYDMVWNAGASGIGSNYDLGFRTGTKIGGTGKPGSFWGGYEFFLIEADATIDAFTEDQIGTNITGHIVKGGVTLAKNVDLFATVNFFRDLESQFTGFGNTLGTTIPGIAMPIDEAHWMIRPRLFLVVKF